MVDLGLEHDDEEYATITPERLSVVCVERAAASLVVVENRPELWFLVLGDLHRALTCALVAALRGSHGTGAFDENGRRNWLTYFEDSRDDPGIAEPAEGRVDSFLQLLGRWLQGTPEMQGGPLHLSAERMADLRRLHKFRGDIEHVKPRSWTLQLVGLPRICGTAGMCLEQLFRLAPVRLHLDESELQKADGAISNLLAFAASRPSSPPPG